MQDIPNEILIEASEGSAAAFEKIYGFACGFVWSIALRVTNSRETAQDVTQEVFLKVHSSLKTFRFQSSFKTWLYKITFNTAINAYRKRSRDLGLRQEYERNYEHIAGAGKEDEHAIDKAYKEQFLEGILRRLNPDQRACILLREKEGLSYEEIGRVLKINVNTVRSRLKRAREALLAIKESQVNYEL